MAYTKPQEDTSGRSGITALSTKPLIPSSINTSKHQLGRTSLSASGSRIGRSATKGENIDPAVLGRAQQVSGAGATGGRTNTGSSLGNSLQSLKDSFSNIPESSREAAISLVDQTEQIDPFSSFQSAAFDFPSQLNEGGFIRKKT